MVLVWRHPEELRTWFMAGTERALLAVKMALEGLSPRDVAEATGVAEAVVREALEECTRSGLLLAP
jgi:transposase